MGAAATVSSATVRKKADIRDRAIINRPCRTGGRSGSLDLHERAGSRAVEEALAAAGAFRRLHLVEVARLQQLRPDRRFRADFAAQPARIADRVVDSDFHGPTFMNRLSRPRR